jgi:hypothetical protein
MLKQFLKKFLIVFLELVILVGVFLFVAQKKGIQIFPSSEQVLGKRQLPPFPELKQPVSKTYSWSYKNQKYQLSLVLDKAAYEYYHTLPKEYSYIGSLPTNWENQYYGMFLAQNSSDNTINDVTEKLGELGRKSSLDDNQLVELVLSFVQSITYDDSKANNILAKKGNETMQYSYETLFVQSGVCSDKSLLAYSILKKMGYGVEILAFEQDNHMAIAIQCPASYANYKDGYCYAETTSVGNKIGIIPSFDKNSNKTVDISQLANFDSNDQQQLNIAELGVVTEYQKSRGREYTGIIETKKIENEIQKSSATIASLMVSNKNQKAQVDNEEAALNSLKSMLENYKKSGKIDKYNENVPKYNSMLEKYKKDVENFNKNVSLYNKTVARYNELITQ